jgi:hypothetical protein
MSPAAGGSLTFGPKQRDATEERAMTRVVSGITTSLDGYITGPNDGPGKGLGEGGERLHY